MIAISGIVVAHAKYILLRTQYGQMARTLRVHAIKVEMKLAYTWIYDI